MARDALAALLQRARDDQASEVDAIAAAALLPTLTDSMDRYDALFVIGKAGDTRHRALVESYLEEPDDPFLSRLAIQILGNWWGMANDYKEQLRRFVAGVPWDMESGSYVRSVAISAAGGLLREVDDRDLLAALLAVYDAVEEPDSMRRQAYSALLRAAGKEWPEIPGTASDAWGDAPDTAAIERLRERARR